MVLVAMEEGEGVMSAQRMSARVGTTVSARGATRLLDMPRVGFPFFILFLFVSRGLLIIVLFW